MATTDNITGSFSSNTSKTHSLGLLSRSGAIMARRVAVEIPAGTPDDGALAILVSSDGGTNYYTATDGAGTAITFSAAEITAGALKQCVSPDYGPFTHIKLTLSGATTPSFNYAIYLGE